MGPMPADVGLAERSGAGRRVRLPGRVRGGGGGDPSRRASGVAPGAQPPRWSPTAHHGARAETCSVRRQGRWSKRALSRRAGEEVLRAQRRSVVADSPSRRAAGDVLRAQPRSVVDDGPVTPRGRRRSPWAGKVGGRREPVTARGRRHAPCAGHVGSRRQPVTARGRRSAPRAARHRRREAMRAVLGSGRSSTATPSLRAVAIASWR